MCSGAGDTDITRAGVPPFGDPCFLARLRLNTAYRSLPRPSSAFGAKASTMRPYYLSIVDSRYAVFQRSDAYARGHV